MPGSTNLKEQESPAPWPQVPQACLLSAMTALQSTVAGIPCKDREKDQQAIGPDGHAWLAGACYLAQVGKGVWPQRAVQVG